MPAPALTPGRGAIVAARRNTPPFPSGKTVTSSALRRDFSDARHWRDLADKYLPQYTLPRRSERATPEALALWLERMELPERAFLRMGGYRDVQDGIDLNPSWPLRALVGLALEIRSEADR